MDSSHFLAQWLRTLPVTSSPYKGSTVHDRLHDQLIMPKRPFDPESLPIPESKHARQERSLRDLIPPHKLSHVNQDLQVIPIGDESDSTLHEIYRTIRGFVGFIENDELETLGRSLVTKDAFYTNARMQQAHFFSLVTAAAAEKATDDDVLALINSSMYTFIRG